MQALKRLLLLVLLGFAATTAANSADGAAGTSV
jgi:hypothetical protein